CTAEAAQVGPQVVGPAVVGHRARWLPLGPESRERLGLARDERRSLLGSEPPSRPDPQATVVGDQQLDAPLAEPGEQLCDRRHGSHSASGGGGRPAAPLWGLESGRTPRPASASGCVPPASGARPGAFGLSTGCVPECVPPLNRCIAVSVPSLRIAPDPRRRRIAARTSDARAGTACS